MYFLFPFHFFAVVVFCVFFALFVLVNTTFCRKVAENFEETLSSSLPQTFFFSFVLFRVYCLFLAAFFTTRPLLLFLHNYFSEKKVTK